MVHRDIVVIGASTGGFKAIKQIIASLPATLQATIFIVWHMAPDVQGILPEVLTNLNTLPASNAIDGEPIKMGHIYVAPPDHHLLVEKDCVRVTRGPKENHFRPAIDPLFRSAAYAYGSRVTGVILSGAMDDGSAGLWTIKQQGGLAVVQDPADAEVPSMPENALRAVQADYQLPVSEIGAVLTHLCTQPITNNREPDMKEQEKQKREVQIALAQNPLQNAIIEFGELSPYTCPECHGVLTRIEEGSLLRFRCHTGHAYSVDSLLVSLTENIEANIWTAIRSIQESIILLNDIGDRYADANLLKLAAVFFWKSQEAAERATYLRKAVYGHDQLSVAGLRQQAEPGEAETAVRQ